MKKLFSKKVAAIAIAGTLTLSLINLSRTSSYDDQLGQATSTVINEPVAAAANIATAPQFWSQLKEAGKAAGKALWEAGEWVVYYTQFAPPPTPTSRTANVITLNSQIAAKQQEIKMAALN